MSLIVVVVVLCLNLLSWFLFYSYSDFRLWPHSTYIYIYFNPLIFTSSLALEAEGRAVARLPRVFPTARRTHLLRTVFRKLLRSCFFSRCFCPWPVVQTAYWIGSPLETQTHVPLKNFLISCEKTNFYLCQIFILSFSNFLAFPGQVIQIYKGYSISHPGGVKCPY